MNVHLRGKEINWISVNAFLYFNSKVYKRLPKKLPMGKEITNVQTNLVKLPYSAQKVLPTASILVLFLFLFVEFSTQGAGTDEVLSV